MMKIKVFVLSLICSVFAFAQNYYVISNDVLPVELVYFQSQIFAPDSIQLLWGTATESQNYGFDVERKTNNSGWETLGFVEGNGNSNSPKHYNFGDSSLTENSVYRYRLKQIDIVGTFKYSDTLIVNYLTDVNEEPVVAPSDFSIANAYPNPFNGGTKINYNLNRRFSVAIKVYDVRGREVADLINTVQDAGSYQVLFNPSKELSAGVYFYKLYLADEKGNLKSVTINKLVYLK